MTVGELLRRIDARELREWAAYENVAGPVGPERTDIQHAYTRQLIAAVNRKSGSPIPKISDFMIDWYKAYQDSRTQENRGTVEMDWQAMQANFMAATTDGKTRKKK